MTRDRGTLTGVGDTKPYTSQTACSAWGGNWAQETLNLDLWVPPVPAEQRRCLSPLTPSLHCSFSHVTSIVADNPTSAAFDATELACQKTELLTTDFPA